MAILWPKVKYWVESEQKGNGMTLGKQFENPGVEWRGKPFWSWNGKLEKGELLRQIDVIKAMGFGGFFMHSRTGLETEYLGDEWFDLINTCADRGEELGLESWLYDEDRWPSGLAGGMVSKHPEFRQKAILLDLSDPSNPTDPSDRIIGQWVAKVESATCTELEPFGGTVPEGKTLLTFRVVEQGTSGFYNGYTYVDTMNRDATEAFLQSTHEKYADKCGGRLGRSIKGIFTDEPHRGALLDGFSMYRDDGTYCLPYTQKLFEEFEKRFGYDLKPRLPELFLQVDGKRISPVKWHYTELLQQLFLENFAIPCKAWCEEHNLVLSGHVLHEDSLSAQTAMSGSMMRYYEHMTAPGVDVLSEGNRNYWVVKQLASAARQTGKTQLLSELYGCTGWQMAFSGHKAVGDWQALLGINLRCHHLSWYTMRGEAKRDYPASILHQSAWYREYKHVEDYFARFGLVMAQGKPVCDVLVINPVESVWAQVHLGWSKGLSAVDDHIQELEEQYKLLFTWLLESQVDFDYGDEEMLSRLASIEGTALRVGQATYKTVVVSGMDTIRSSTVKLLEEFQSSGGTVIVVGKPPEFIDALPGKLPPFGNVPFEKDSVVSALPESLATVAAPDIFGQLRRTDDGLVFAALNVNREERCENALVRIKTECNIEEWNCETGERIPVAAETSKGWKSFTTNFPVGGNKLYVASAGTIKAEQAPLPALYKEHAIRGSFRYTLSEPNICVLDFAEYKTGAGNWQAALDVLKIDQQVRDGHGIMRRGGEMRQPWFVAQHPIKELCNIELRYGFEIAAMPEWMDLVIEEPENFSVEINGQPLDLSASEPWIDIAFHRIRIPADLLHEAKNEIVLETLYKENSNIEAVYLLGEFGVQLDGIRRTLVPRAGKVQIGDLCRQGFPFYSGAITYQVPLPADTKRLRLPCIGAACAKVNGQVLGWDPFEAEVSDCGTTVDVELVLTRRNTFGPLHDAVPNRAHNGPDHWLTVGDDFSDQCILIESGLVEAPLAMV
ncbi:MAG: hypothetical protein DRP64_06085 [Verrucomicrobia bacterium]|nr:MAG: hypothetical protein DRP64_06085 [Verrucomicrobiota bacterium]